MTREEAIKYIECGEISNRWGKEGEEAERMAIEALKAEPKLRQALEQEKGAYNALVANVHCNDCISRQAAIYAINHAGVNFNVKSKFDLSVLSKEIREIVCHIAEAQEKALNDLPLVTPQQRMGRWEEYYTFQDPMTPKYRCSICKEPMEKILDGNQLVEWWSDYCPKCGAKMEVEE